MPEAHHRDKEEILPKRRISNEINIAESPEAVTLESNLQKTTAADFTKTISENSTENVTEIIMNNSKLLEDLIGT